MAHLQRIEFILAPQLFFERCWEYLPGLLNSSELHLRLVETRPVGVKVSAGKGPTHTCILFFEVIVCCG